MGAEVGDRLGFDDAGAIDGDRLGLLVLGDDVGRCEGETLGCIETGDTLGP